MVEDTGERNRLADMSTAIRSAINDGDSVYLTGFTHLIPFSAGHEIIRQGYSDLHLIRATPDLIYDRLIAADCASKVTFSWAGNPGVGSLRAFRRAIEDEVPSPLEIDEYTHFGLMTRLAAGARGLPFQPVKTFAGSDLPKHNDNIRKVDNPFGNETVYAVPPLNPDVAVIRAQRADPSGNAQVWGIEGEISEAAHAAEQVVVCVEEVVEEAITRSDPNRTVITSADVDYVVEDPYGSHPSYAQGYYDRDNEAYLEWDEVTKSHERTEQWLEEWVYDLDNHDEYLEKLNTERLLTLDPDSDYATPVDMGKY
jgi:glutaconate CoA-transferase subunit A